MMLFKAIKELIISGHSVDFGRLTICDLGEEVQTRRGMKKLYQVECNDARYRYTEIYSNLNVAIDKFMAIRGILNASGN